MIKHSFTKQIKYLMEFTEILSSAIDSKEKSKVPFMIYHLIKQCPDMHNIQLIKAKDYSHVYIRLYRSWWTKKESDQCIKKLDKLIL
jgi:hypothetical protein